MGRDQPSPWQPEQDRIRLAVLGKLLEELGECVQIASRCVIQGLDERDPDTGAFNFLVLEQEMADVRAAMDLCLERLDVHDLVERTARKRDHLRGWHALIEGGK